ncbi:unnamed protein product [Linum trigynum]|uniref:Retrotransposon gag domain-containing protein n=1 Tax=Linum trigynum TaxID=586398 RepID=A0AAV2EVU8_9ROSI
MAPRRRNLEGDVPAGFVEDQVANIEYGQASDAVAGGNGGAETLVATAPGGDLGEAVGALRQMMEENRKMVADTHQATEENRQMQMENRRMLEETRANTHQVNSQIDCLNSRLDRRFSQLLEVVNKNANEVDQLRQSLGRPVVQSRALPLDGIGLTPTNSVLSPAGGRNGQPRQETLPPQTASQPPPRRVGDVEIPVTTQVGESSQARVGVEVVPPRGENLATMFNTRVEQPPVQVGARPSIPEARPYVAPVNLGVGGGLGGNIDQIPPRGYPTPMPPHFNGHGMDPIGFVPYAGQQGGHEANTLRDQVAQLLTEQFGMGVRPAMPPVYRKPYPEWVDRLYPFPRGFRVPEFATFTGTGDQSTVEHVGCFTVQCGDVGDFVKLRLFGNSLTGPAFAWYVNLPSNSIQTWQQMEQVFHAQFYRSEPEVSMADLARMRQQPGESVEHFLTNFKNARNRCFVNLTEREFVKLAQGGLSFELRKKFQDGEFSDLFQLMSCAVRYESLLHEEENRRSASRGPYFPNLDYTINHIGHEANEVEVDLAEITPGKPYICASLSKVEEGPQGGRPNRAPIQPRKYSFDVSKADLIFDQLYKDGQVKLTGGHVFPSPEKLKGKKYCKWHNSMSHATDSCVVFRNVLQDAIEKGRIKFPEAKKDAMLVDTDPFPKVLGVNMVNPDFSKFELPRFKLVLDTTPPRRSPNVVLEKGSSSGTKQARPAAMMTDEVDKLCARCKKSLKLDKDKWGCPSVGQVVSKKPHQPKATHFCDKYDNMVKYGQEGTPPITNNGHEGKFNKERRGKGRKSCHSLANLAKSRQGSISPTMKNGVGSISKKTQQVKPPHGFCKCEIMDKGGLGGKSMSMNSKYSTLTTKSGHGGMYKKSPYRPAKHGCTKNQWWLSAKCRGQQVLYVERRRQESYKSGCRLVKPRPGLQHREEIKHVSSGRKSRQKNNHDSLDMSSKVAQAKKHDTSCKATKTRQADYVPPISKLENSKLMYEDSSLMEEKSHVVYGWYVWFDPWTWQWVYTFGTLIVAKGYGEQ